MFSNWKLDWQHVLIILAFLVGVVWAGGAAIAALPAGTSFAAGFAALLPVLILGASHVFAFLKSPPSSPDQALQQGESALGAAGKAAQRGIARLGVLMAFAAIGVVCFTMQAFTGAPVIHPMTVQGQGCSWWQKNSNIVEQYGQRDVLCVFNSIMGGAASYGAVAVACAPLTIEQIAQISVNLFDFYALQETDAGLAGAALPPALSLPKSLAAGDFAKLQAFVKSAH